MQQPRIAFVSHATADKARFVTEFARKLRDRGVDAWLDQWEMGPGDSLVNKIFSEGIANADALIVILSENSIDSAWVQAELNVAVIRRIEEKMKLIPVVLDNLNRTQIPMSIRDALYIKVNDLDAYDMELGKIVNSIYDLHEKPPLGAPPPYSQAADEGIRGLTRGDGLVLKVSCETAIEQGEKWPDFTNVRQRVNELGIPEDEMHEALEVLDQRGYIEATRFNGDNSEEIGFFKVTASGFRAYAERHVSEYTPLTNSVAALLVNDNATSSANIANTLKKPPIMIEFILDDLEIQGHVELITYGQGGADVSNVHPSLRRMVRANAPYKQEGEP